MKSLESLLSETTNVSQEPPVSKNIDPTPVPEFQVPDSSGVLSSEMEADQSSVTATDDIVPEYLYTDSQVVGYNDSQTQSDIYNFSIMGVLPLFGQASILDIGGGRSDLFFHIKNELPGLVMDYTSYELNPLLIHIAKEKLADYGGEVIQDDVLNAPLTKKFDHVFLIGSININYGWDGDHWSRLELLLRKSLDLCNESVTFVLLQDNGGEDQYISYPIPNLTELVLMFNYPFSIQYGDIPGVYKLTIKKKPIYITQ
jgi:hypothetical protein